jgi:hypothetical protein
MAAAVEEQHQDARAIVQAAGRGDLEEVRRLVQQNRMLLDAEWDDRSPLTAAANRGRLEVVRYLLDEGADINLWTGEYGTALATACSKGRLELASLLLARGADATASSDGWGPLRIAAQRGHTDIVELLLAHGCGDIDAQWLVGRAALHDACSNGHAGVARALLGAGANPHVVDQFGCTPLREAVLEGREGCVALLQVICLCCECGRFKSPGWPTIVSAMSPARVLILCPRSSHSHTHRSGGAATSSPRPAASATPLIRWLTAKQPRQPQ